MIVYVVDVQEEDHNLYEELAWEEFHLLLRTLEEWYLLQKNQEDLNATQKTLEKASYPCAPDLGLFSL